MDGIDRFLTMTEVLCLYRRVEWIIHDLLSQRLMER